MDEEIHQSLCNHYNDLLKSPASTAHTCVEVAFSVLSNVTLFRRETVLLSLTTLTQHLSRYPVEWRTYLRDGVMMKLVCVLSDTPCRFVLHASRDLIIALHQSLLSQPDVTEEELLQLAESLTILQKTSLGNKREDSLTAVLEIVAHSFSIIRKLSTNGHLLNFVNGLLTVVHDSISAVLATDSLPCVFTCAVFRCLSKVVKMSRQPAYDWLTSACVSHLTGPLAQRLLMDIDKSKDMILMEYFKCCRLLLQPSTDVEMDKHDRLALSQWIYTHAIEKLLQRMYMQVSCETELTSAGKGDLSLTRCTVHVLLLTFSRLLSSSAYADVADSSSLLNRLGDVHVCVSQFLGYSSSNESFSLWFLDLFFEQDDAMVEGLMVLLDLYTHLTSLHSTVEKDWFCPWKMFSTLVGHISYDHYLLLDLLSSPETQFLRYFLSFLHHLIASWDKITLSFVLDNDFVSAEEETGPDIEMVSLTSGLEQLMTYNDDCSETSDEVSEDSLSDGDIEEPTLQNIIGVLEKLRQRLVQISHNDLIHFNITPLIGLLWQVRALAVKTGVLR